MITTAERTSTMSRTFTLDPLDGITTATIRAKVLYDSNLIAMRALDDAVRWIPETDAVAMPTRFTITQHRSNHPSLPRLIYHVATVPTRGKPDVFGLAVTLDAAEHLARAYMAMPTPGRRYGYGSFTEGGYITPAVWVNKSARARYFQSTITQKES